MAKSLIDVAKHENKLRQIIQLNEIGAILFTDKTSQAIASGVSKSEFIEAFKDDIDKTARFLVDSLGIINSIQNGLIMELSTLDNDVESFFRSTYKDGIISLCGIKFDINKRVSFGKSELIDFIYKNLFDIDKKELSFLSKALTKYETATTDIEKAVLYPSTILADKLIEKIGYIDQKFNEYRKTLSYEDNLEFTTIFNRSGVTDVIQNSTYIDSKGVRQTVHKNHLHILSEISDGIKSDNFKYIEAIEIDGDGDVVKALKVIKQIERLKINCESKFTLKFRKLGNLNARGIFFSSNLIVAEDVRDTSALIHEIAHFIHLTNASIFESKFVNHMINKLSKRIDFNNLQVSDYEKDEISKKSKYYCDPKEIIARALEIAALFANEQSRVIFGTDDLDMIKSRAFYEGYEGIYFNFNSFDDETIEEMLQLWELFYETSYDETQNSNIDNFYKININYRRTLVENVKTAKDLLKEEMKREEKEKKALYSMVTGENIQLIINNKPSTLPLEMLSTVIFQNIEYCGAHKKSNTVDDWIQIIENDWARIFLSLNDELKSSLSNREYVMFLIELESLKILDILRTHIGLDGFNIDFRMKLKRQFKESKNINYTSYKNWQSQVVKSPLLFAEINILEDIDFLKSYISNNPFAARSICKLNEISKTTVMEIGYFMLENMIDKKSFIPGDCFNDFDFAFKFMSLAKDVIYFTSISEELKNSITFMNGVLPFFEGNLLIIAFSNIGKNLSTDIEFMKYWVSKEPLLIKYVDESIKVHFEPKIEEKKSKKSKTVTDKIEKIKEIQKENFEELIKTATIEDFEHTQTKEILKVMKVNSYISDFKAFNEYLTKNDIAYYSKYARGFIIKNIEKVQTAAIVTSTIYSAEILANFANGTLF
ncbi:hypothetical protein [Aliarcobacter butzleri]|uniref:Uncharacterized protein n=1 Tax=Aliarcobacter butzleri L348 TaxID=1447256 RepID=A0A0G9K5W3_9BACT|nr:hypothetical protein [Aliarcobacter butzleri]KLE01851.1 hypothetical protein AA20_02185 [Aliarcobacter butzleri L348]MDN5095281.1 hypothetical protein [Aliarcobacter butzleri]